MTEALQPRKPLRLHKLACFLAGFLPVAVFGVVLLMAMGEWGVVPGILAGTALGAIAAWALTRLIAAYSALLWIAAVTMGLLGLFVVLSFF